MNTMNNANNNIKQKYISLILASMSIACVILAMILTNFTEITDTTISKNEQIIANKKPLSYPLTKDIKHFQLASTTDKDYDLTIEISFSEEKDIQIKQKHEYDNADYIDIDFKQLDWQVQDDTLILNIDKALSADNRYFYETLKIRLPKQLNEISIANDFTRKHYQIINQDEPINLTVSTNKANFVGNFNQLIVKQINSCNKHYYDNSICFTFDDVQVDTLSMVTPPQVVAEHNQKYKDDKNEPPALFKLLLDGDLTAQQIILNVPKNSDIKITNLELLDKIKWEEVEKIKEVSPKPSN